MARLDNIAPVGSLFKAPRLEQRHKRMRSARVLDDAYLAMIRQCPCLACGQDPAGEAAHVRQASAAHGKPNPGMGQKPDDKWAVPLCHDCHMRQHSEGELTFWYHQRISPVHMCVELYKRRMSLEAMRGYIMGSNR